MYVDIPIIINISHVEVIIYGERDFEKLHRIYLLPWNLIGKKRNIIPMSPNTMF